MTEIENLKQWLTERLPLFNIKGIERECQVPAGTIRQFIYLGRNLPAHHLEKIIPVLQRIGYVPVEHQREE